MPTYFTKNEARNAANVAGRQFRRAGKLAGRILRDEAASATSYDKFDVFLSHASKDAELVLGTKAILENQGLKVYVDWIEDAYLDRSKVNTETANLLRTRMRQSNSLIWMATHAASESKWMPWELGYFDGFKPKHVAILPLTDSATDRFIGQEYLGLYPLVNQDRLKGLGINQVFIDSGYEWSSLKSFATGAANFTKY